MAREIRDTVLLNTIFNNELVTTFPTTKVLIAPWLKVAYTFETNSNQAYTRVSKFDKSKFRIHLGGRLISEAASLPYSISRTDKNLKKYAQDSICAMRGLFYHELGHLIFTDMKCTLIKDYKEAKYRGFLHNVFNTLEDVAMERAMELSYSSSKYYFTFLKKTLFSQMQSNYYDRNDLKSFMSYLLLRLRLGKSLSITNKFYDDNQEDIKKYVLDVLREKNATKRIEKSIIFGEWLISKFDFQCEDQEPNQEFEDGMCSSGSGTEPMESPTEDDSLGSCNDFGLGSGESTVHEAEDIEETMPADVANIDMSDIKESFNDILNSGDDKHLFFTASEEFEPNNKVKDRVQEIFTRNSALALNVAKSFNNFKTKAKPRLVGGFNSGKLDLRKAMKNSLTKSIDTKVFRQRQDIGIASEPMVYILIDNSGSMSDDKSRICTNATVALAQACEITRIPLAISCFTEYAGTCETIKLKTFKQSLQDALPYLGIIHTDLYRNYTYNDFIRPFWGNVDEVNLYYVWKEYLKEKNKDKLLIVISDGCTCGSHDSLKKVINEIQKSGISVIGLGIQDNTVSYAYPEYKVFNTYAELASLPEYLANILHRFVKGGER